MAITVLPQQYNPWAQAGAEFGSGIGGGISNGLQMLVEKKLMQMQHDQSVKDLQSAFPELPNTALNFLARQAPQQQMQYLQMYGQGLQNLQSQQPFTSGLQPQAPAVTSLDTRKAITPQNITAEEKTLLRNALSNPEITKQYSPKILKALEPYIAETPEQQQKQARRSAAAIAEELPSLRTTAVKTPAATTKIAPVVPMQPETPQQAAVAQKAPALAAEEKPSLLKALAKPAATIGPKEQLKEQARISKETQKFYDSTLEQASVAKKSDQRLNRMEQLIKKGDLPTSAFYTLFKNMEEAVPTTHGAAAGGALGAALGSVVPGLGTVVGGALGATIGGLISPVGTMLRFAQRKINPDTEEFEKLSNNFIDQAKSIFGSRITDADLKSFMSTVPTLANTDEGKKAIIRNMRVFNKAAEVKANAMKQIIKENDGKRPENLAILVEERAQANLDKLAKRFESGEDLV